MFIIALLLHSCDPCSYDVCIDCGGSPSGSIFFWAVSLNDDTPNIYSLSPDGSKYKQIIRNGLIYSPPSSNNKIVYIRNDKSGKSTIRMADIDGSSDYIFIDTVLESEGFSFPVLSPDGMTVAVINKEDEIWLFYQNRYVVDRMGSIMRGSLPSFSPNGSYKLIAIFEGNALNGPVIINIKRFDTSHVREIWFSSKQFNHGFDLTKGLLQVGWSNDGTKIIYAVNDDSSSNIYINDIFSGSEKIINVKSFGGAAAPIFSPNPDIIAFTAGDGRIWKADVSNPDSPGFWPLTDKDTLSINKHAQWSHDGKYLIYTNYPMDEGSDQLATLYIIDGKKNDGAGRKMLINFLFSINNFPRSFWGR